ncbi:hypothetical protein K438DRAFT_1774932 [Mycena galopus ATCC 62051]|nr:hypothetical protein K438DRAFT_1774932 [Mycena galopus ATCC 62051]
MATFGRSSKPLFGTMSIEICGKRTSTRRRTNLLILFILLDNVHAGINHFIANSSMKPPADFPIMRFVRVAFATEGKQANAGDQSRPRSLSDIFGSRNIPSGYKTFTISHQCNTYCEYFQIANSFDFPVDMPISVANTKQTSSSAKRKAEESSEQPNSHRHRRVSDLVSSLSAC